MLIPLGDAILALSQEDFEKALALGRETVGTTDGESAASAPEKLLDAAGMAEMTGIPSSWFLEAARQGRIPHVKAGKYVRFRMADVIEALEVRPNGHKASVAFGVKKVTQKQPVIKRATKLLPP